MNNNRISNRVKLTGLWCHKDRNGNGYMKGSISPICTMLVFGQKKTKENSPDCAAYFMATHINKNNDGSKNRENVNRNDRIKLAGLWKKVDDNGAVFYEGRIAPGCILIIERYNCTDRGENAPHFIAFICSPQSNDDFFDTRQQNNNDIFNTVSMSDVSNNRNSISGNRYNSNNSISEHNKYSNRNSVITTFENNNNKVEAHEKNINDDDDELDFGY